MKLILSNNRTGDFARLNLIDGRLPQVAMTCLIDQSFTPRAWFTTDANGDLDKALQAIHRKHLWALESYTRNGIAFWTLTCSVGREKNPVMI